MSCGDKCKCDCCKAKKKAAAAARRRAKQPKKQKPQKSNQPIIINVPLQRQAYPTLNVSNHPSTLPRSAATQTDRANTRTIETQTDVIRPLPEIPRLREGMTAPSRPVARLRRGIIQRREVSEGEDERPPQYGYTTRTGRLATVRITEPQAEARGYNRLSSLMRQSSGRPRSASAPAPPAPPAPADADIRRLITRVRYVENPPVMN